MPELCQQHIFPLTSQRLPLQHQEMLQLLALDYFYPIFLQVGHALLPVIAHLFSNLLTVLQDVGQVLQQYQRTQGIRSIYHRLHFESEREVHHVGAGSGWLERGQQLFLDQHDAEARDAESSLGIQADDVMPGAGGEGSDPVVEIGDEDHLVPEEGRELWEGPDFSIISFIKIYQSLLIYIQRAHLIFQVVPFDHLGVSVASQELLVVSLAVGPGVDHKDGELGVRLGQNIVVKTGDGGPSGQEKGLMGVREAEKPFDLVTGVGVDLVVVGGAVGSFYKGKRSSFEVHESGVDSFQNFGREQRRVAEWQAHQQIIVVDEIVIIIHVVIPISLLIKMAPRKQIISPSPYAPHSSHHSGNAAYSQQPSYSLKSMK